MNNQSSHGKPGSNQKQIKTKSKYFVNVLKINKNKSKVKQMVFSIYRSSGGGAAEAALAPLFWYVRDVLDCMLMVC